MNTLNTAALLVFQKIAVSSCLSVAMSRGAELNVLIIDTAGTTHVVFMCAS